MAVWGLIFDKDDGFFILRMGWLAALGVRRTEIHGYPLRKAAVRQARRPSGRQIHATVIARRYIF